MTTDDEQAPHVPSTPRCLTYAVGAAALLSSCLVAAGYFHAGTNMAIKIVTGLLMPVGLIWLFFFTGGVLYAMQKRRGLSLLFFGIWLTVGVLFNARVGQKFISSVEAPMPQIPPEAFPLRAVVVLGGGTMVNSFGTDELTRDGERVMSAAQLWHAGQTKAIICTGGVGDPNLDGCSVSRRLLISVGVPSEVILELRGYNTVEEMASLKELFAQPPEILRGDGKLGLITSAFHMNRAMRLAKDQQLDFLSFPCSYRTSVDKPLTPRDFVPEVFGGGNVAMTLKEWLAALAGR